MIKKIRNLGASGILVALAQVLLIVVIAQFRGLQEIGEYSYILALCVPLNVLGLFGFKQLLASERSPSGSFEYVLKKRFVFHSTIYFLFLAFAVSMSLKVSLPLLVAVSLFKYIESHHELALGNFQSQHNIDSIDKLNGFKLFVYLFISIMVIIGSIDLFWIFLLGSTMFVIHYLLVLSPQLAFSQKSESSSSCKSVFKKAAYLVVISLCTALLANVPKYYLMAFSSIEQLAIFTLFFQALSFINMFVINLVNYQWGKIKKSVQLNITETRSNIRNRNVTKIFLLISVLSLVVVSFSFISIEVVYLVFNIDSRQYFIEWLLINIAFALNFYSHLLNALNILLQREKPLAIGTVIILLIAVLIWPLIPKGSDLLGASLLLLTIFTLKSVFGTFILLKEAKSDD